MIDEIFLKLARISTFCQLVVVAFLSGYTRGWELPALAFGYDTVPYSGHYFFLFFLTLLQLSCLLSNRMFFRLLSLLPVIASITLYCTKILGLKIGLADEIDYTSYWIRESFLMDFVWGGLVLVSISCTLMTFLYTGGKK